MKKEANIFLKATKEKEFPFNGYNVEYLPHAKPK